MNRIEEIKTEIFKFEKLSDLGIDIYKENNKSEFLKDAVYYRCRADELKKILKEEYNVVV